MSVRSVSIQVETQVSVSGALHVPDDDSGIGVILGHGAGNDMWNPLLVAVCEGLAECGHAALRFNIPYKERGQRVPDPRATLHTIEGGDHSFGLLKSAGRTVESVHTDVVTTIDGWMAGRFGGKV